ncbi:MAG: VCBS repeat-containing protein [Pyrinomonadaceae bacterium]|nr:VCBS repeat-containing protein [Pyrinomonadaceae bacterium]
MFQTKRISIIAQSILLIFAAAFSISAAGEVDTSFQANLNGVPSGTINKIVVQPDGKTLAGGNFRIVANLPRVSLFRMNVDGTLDAGFQPPQFYISSGIGGIINSIALQPDGKILVGGNFLGANNVARPGLMRLNVDGSMDTTFDAQINSGGTVVDIHVLSDGRIAIGGSFTINNAVANRIGIAMLNSNGTLDPTIYQNIVSVTKILPLPDGRLIAGNQNSVRRFNIDGAFDPGFAAINTSSTVLDLQLLSSGKILIAGNFNMVNGFSLRGLFRINPDGTVDTTYNQGGSDPNPSINGITPAPNGKFFIFGPFSGYNGVGSPRVALIDENGVRDNSYNFSGSIVPLDLAVLPDGKVFLGGTGFGGSNPQNAILRTNADGSLDNSFSLLIGTSPGTGYTVLVQPDGKVLVGGTFPYANGVFRPALVRFNADGSYDHGFAPPNFGTSVGIYHLALQPDGKIIVPIWNGSSGVTYRLNPNGSTDVTISSPFAHDAEVLPNGQFLVAHGDRVRRYNPNTNGSFDPTFTSLTTNGSDEIYDIAVQPDGKIVVVGTFTSFGGQTRGRMARLNADGTLDSTFNPPGGSNANIHTVLVQSDGKILIGGAFTGINFDSTKKYLARLNPDGSLDASFSPVLNSPVLGLKIQPNGKILIGGAMSTLNGALRPGIGRINQDGSLDASFDAGSGTNSTVWSVDLQGDKIIYVGQFSATNGITTLGIGRLLNAAAPQTKLFDYDGDGRADVSVFRPSENRWYIFRSSDSVVLEKVFAVANDIPAPADFDGDGKTDIGIFRPSTGDWWYLSSINNAQVQTHWGASGDVPRPSDFDGDGKADFVIFRPSENNWYRLGSSGQVSIVNFGSSGDKPVIGDFDGDGKADPAVYRPSTGTWWYRSSINNAQIATNFGISTDIPAPADFDGDGKTDLAVYRPSNGVWYILNSSNGQATVSAFGLNGDKPVPADYDGDGKADVAVFRPSNGVWYLLRSTQGFFAQQFGISTDIPTENAFVP